MTVIGYIRVSSNKQTLEHQHFEIEQFSGKNHLPVDLWIEEKISSREDFQKRKLFTLLNNLKENDILLTCEISRLGRSLLEVMKILETCLHKNCQVWTIKENYRLGNDIQSKVLAFAFGLAAEIERNLISQRTKASLANIKANGKKLGRPFSKETQKLKTHIRQMKIMLAAGVSKSEIARFFAVKPSTVRHFLERMHKF